MSAAGWKPPTEIETQRAGVHWDAIRIREPLATSVLAALGNRTGAVIEDTLGGPTWYWLVPAGTADTWDVAGSDALGAACWVTVPGPQTRGRIRWRVPPTATLLTGPRLLTDALDRCSRG